MSISKKNFFIHIYSAESLLKNVPRKNRNSFIAIIYRGPFLHEQIIMLNMRV